MVHALTSDMWQTPTVALAIQETGIDAEKWYSSNLFLDLMNGIVMIYDIY